MSRDNAVCISTCDNKGVWITHIRRVKEKDHSSLWPKVPALQALHELQEAGVTIHGLTSILPLQYGADVTNGWHRSPGTFQEIWIEFEVVGSDRVAYLHFDFYNGAMSTAQCKRLLRSLRHLVQSSTEMPLAAIVLMGGSYFSNGIHLNVIETAADPAQESWLNINAINDLAQYVLQELPARGIAAIAAVRGNCAAGGVALAASCDRVLAGEAVVINPAYGAMGLSGSEFHTMTYHKRCKSDAALQATVSTLPLSAWAAKEIGLVDEVIPGCGHSLDASIRANIAHLLQFSKEAQSSPILPWKRSLDLGTISVVRTAELAEMAKDFWSPRSERYHTRRRAFVTKQKPTATPIQFALHRKHDGVADEEIDGTCGSTEPSIPRESMETGYPSIKTPIATNIPPSNSQSATTVRVATTTQHGETLLGSNSGILFGCYYNADS
jgi:enoyl-CoA hydratase/carnithine racemase